MKGKDWCSFVVQSMSVDHFMATLFSSRSFIISMMSFIFHCCSFIYVYWTVVFCHSWAVNDVTYLLEISLLWHQVTAILLLPQPTTTTFHFCLTSLLFSDLLQVWLVPKNKVLGIVRQVFTGYLPFLSPNEQCQSTATITTTTTTFDLCLSCRFWSYSRLDRLGKSSFVNCWCRTIYGPGALPLPTQPPKFSPS